MVPHALCFSRIPQESQVTVCRSGASPGPPWRRKCPLQLHQASDQRGIRAPGPALTENEPGDTEGRGPA